MFHENSNSRCTRQDLDWYGPSSGANVGVAKKQKNYDNCNSNIRRTNNPVHGPTFQSRDSHMPQYDSCNHRYKVNKPLSTRVAQNDNIRCYTLVILNQVLLLSMLVMAVQMVGETQTV